MEGAVKPGAHGARREALEERLLRRQAELLREHLAELRAEQRDELPLAPTAWDRALAATATPAERARVDALLIEAGFDPMELLAVNVARVESANDAPADELTRARARALLGGRGR